MKIEFRIEYATIPGECICVVGNRPVLGNGEELRAFGLTCVDGRHWQGCVETEAGVLEYAYVLKTGERVSRREWGGRRQAVCAPGCNLRLEDAWRDVPEQRFLYTSPFRNAFAAPVDTEVTSGTGTHQLELSLWCPYVMRGQSVVLLGESDLLGDWKETEALTLQQREYGLWSVVLDACRLTQPLQYKFAICDRATGRVIHWEEGDNRVLLPWTEPFAEPLLWRHELHYRHGSMHWRGAGVAIPVFSLRTDRSFGVGEFSDLRRMVDWAVAVGLKLIQVLPVNDTTITRTWTDSYPYNAISIYALHPVYFAPADYPLKDKEALHRFQRQADELNALSGYDYERVMALKEDYLTALFDECGAEVLASDAFVRFFSANRHWLFPYACFCWFRDRHRTADYTSWGAHAVYDRKALEELLARQADMKRAVDRTFFVQYLLHEQLSGVKDYAHKHGVVLKGDVPIGISHDSVEAWVEPQLFNLDTQTGAPPDDFSVTGQNWGFPIYNWPAMAADGYQWWIRRFRKMADYFDAYRIDHILGFFRIWEIPAHSVQGLLGRFSPALPMTEDEIRRWGVPFDEQRMLVPYIHSRHLADIFGTYAGEAESLYLNRITWERFELKPFCNTQVKIRDFFAGRTDDKSVVLRDGLYRLCNEVLFLRDRHEADQYHPRISAQHTYAYADLDEEVKRAFDRLYEHFYYERHNAFWAEQALCKLPVLTAATDMLPCGEDLGMIPACVPDVMRQLQILSLEIERMPKQYGRAFEDLQHIPYASVCTTSTHDMNPLRAWWTEDRALTRRYYREVLGGEGDAPADATPEVCRQIVMNHLLSPAMWAILPVQDWLSVDAEWRNPHSREERINIPSVPNHYWRYRMHVTLERLLEADQLNENLKNMLNDAGR